MVEMFSGDWIVDFPTAMLDRADLPNAVSYDHFFNEHHFVIEGATMNNGVHPSPNRTIPGTLVVVVSGASWFISLEWFNPLVGWLPNPVPLRRIGAAYTPQGALILSLQADNTLAGGGGIPFRTITLSCRNIDPQLNPWYPFVNPYDFTLQGDDRWIDPPDPQG